MKRETIIILGLFIAFLLAFCISVSAQDSIRLKVIKVRTEGDKTLYWLKDQKGNRYYTLCTCKRRKKGEYVMIAEKDFIIIKK